MQKNENDNKNLGSLLLLYALRNNLTGSQTVADAFANASSLSGEDATENGAMGDSSSVSSSIQDKSIVFSNGKLTITNESVECNNGGSITFSGSQNISVSNRTDFYNKTTTFTNGSRSITYSNCIVSGALTINSGTLTISQQTADSGSTTLVSQISSGSSTSGILKRTLNNMKSSIQGTLNVTLTTTRGTSTGDLTIDQVLTLTSRVRTWTITNGKVSKPSLESRSGTLTGSVTISGTKYTIQKTIGTSFTVD